MFEPTEETLKNSGASGGILKRRALTVSGKGGRGRCLFRTTMSAIYLNSLREHKKKGREGEALHVFSSFV